MTIDTSKMHIEPFAFAGSVGTMTVTEPEGDLNVTLKISTRLSTLFSTQITFAYSQTIKIDWSSILISMISMLDRLYATPKRPIAILDRRMYCEILIGDNTIRFLLLRGKMDDESFSKAGMGGLLISSRPQIYRASNNSAVFVYGDLGWESMPKIMADCYFEHSGMKTFELYELDRSGFSEFNIGLKNISGLIGGNSPENDKIVAYDIYTAYIDGSEQKYSDKLRVIVDDRNCYEFSFIGSYGTIESIFGQPYEKVKSDFSSDIFVSDGKESAVRISSAQIHESYSGYIDNPDVSRFWHEFFASDVKYIIRNGVSHLIVVESVESERGRGELASYSFKWHYADRSDNPDLDFSRKTLKEYK